MAAACRSNTCALLQQLLKHCDSELAWLWVLGRRGRLSPVVLQVELADVVEEAAEAPLALQFGQLLPCYLHVVRHVQAHHFDARTTCAFRVWN